MDTTIAAFEAAAHDALARAAADRRSPMRWPVLCTAGSGGPRGRTVVLRRYDRTGPCAEFWTDRRTGKLADLRCDPRAEIVFFDPRRMLQIRASGRASVSMGVDAAAAARAARPADYSTVRAPGEPLEEPGAEDRDEEFFAENFAVVSVTIAAFDVLSLSRTGHRRAFIDFGHRGLSSWRIP